MFEDIQSPPKQIKFSKPGVHTNSQKSLNHSIPKATIPSRLQKALNRKLNTDKKNTDSNSYKLYTHYSNNSRHTQDSRQRHDAFLSNTRKS